MTPARQATIASMERNADRDEMTSASRLWRMLAWLAGEFGKSGPSRTTADTAFP
jgi:hypothetical protein